MRPVFHFNCLIVIQFVFLGGLIIQEHQQTHRSKESNTAFQKQTTPAKQKPISNPSLIIQRARNNPKSLTPADVMQLQRTIGNRAVGRLISEIRRPLSTVQQASLQRQLVQERIKSGTLQAKLKIGQPNDIYEQEADRVAEQVMRMPDPILQRGCDKCHAEDKILQLSSVGSVSKTAPTIVHEVLRSPGQPLDPSTRAFMEPRFGYDFSRVRVHADTKAAESAQAVNALAYTVGNNVVFGAGSYDPLSTQGHRLLAHELTHVVQQSGSEVIRIGHRNENRDLSLISLQVPSMVSSTLIQCTKVCSKRLDNPLGVFFNHSYIDDTGSDNCLGKDMVGNYAIQALYSGNFLKGCALKTATSTDPQGYTPNVKQCNPKPGVKDLSRCLHDAYNNYANPSVYKNPSGPNSNTFAATLAKTCCADGSSKGLGWVPGWDQDPAPPCVFEADIKESSKEEVAT